MAQTPPWDASALPDRDQPVDASSLLVGQFAFDFADERWTWSAQAARIYGYPAQEMHPTSAQVLSHQHPDERAEMTALLEQVRRTRESANGRHRIIDVCGHTHEVIVVSEQRRDATGVVGVHGFYVDVTPTAQQLAATERDHQSRVTEAASEIADRRTIIDEAKGMLMLVYRIDATRAFELLRWRSQVTNTKLRLFAERLIEAFSRVEYGDVLPPRSVFDEILLTAHQLGAAGKAQRKSLANN